MQFFKKKQNIVAFFFASFIWTAAGSPAAIAQEGPACSQTEQPEEAWRPTCQAELNMHRRMGEWLSETLPGAAMDQSNRNYSGQSFSQMDFAGVTLHNTLFNNARLDRANFSGADLTGASFVGADLTRAIFLNANLTNADFSGANMQGTYINGADLTGARLSGVQNISTVNMSETTIFCRTIGYNNEVFSYSCPD